MKHVQKFTAAMLALALVGCGGTGGVAAKPVVSTTINSTPRVEAIVAVQTTNLMHPSEWTQAELVDPTNLAVKADLFDPTVFGVQDPMNIEEGEEMIFQLVTYTIDANHNIISRNIIPGMTFSSSDQVGNSGILASNTGQFLAANNQTTQNFYITTTYQGQNYSAQYAVKIREVRILGTVLDESNPGTPALLAGSQVQFFNASNTLVDTVTIGYDGSIRGSVPTNTTSFTVLGDSLPSNYYHSYTYNSLRYDASVVSCLSPMPTGLIVGTTILSGSILVTPRVTGQSAPPSTGCQSDLARRKHS